MPPKIIETVINYTPRPIQREIQALLDTHRFVVLVAHRRFGKTVTAIMQLIRRAIKDQKSAGSYAYIAPFRGQAKLVAWQYLKRYTAQILDRKINEQELAITLPGEITIRLFGADNPDALRGQYFDGVVLDEVAQMKRETWGEIIRPALVDRMGWALFIGTPKGQNLFFDMYMQAQKDETGDWLALMYRVTDTDVLPEKEIESAKGAMTPNAFRSEFLCDWDASSDDTLISLDEAMAATKINYMPAEYIAMPKVFGLDVARFGDDRTVVFIRQGLRAYAPIVLAKANNVEVATRIQSLYHEHKPARIYVDAGAGAGVIDILRQTLNCVIEVPFGGGAIDGLKFLNRRAEMWYRLREWIRAGGQIPNDSSLITELTAPVYFFNANGKIQLEPKERIKDRLGVSPDLADALALTFAENMMPQMGERQMYAEKPPSLYSGYEVEQGRNRQQSNWNESLFNLWG